MEEEEALLELLQKFVPFLCLLVTVDHQVTFGAVMNDLSECFHHNRISL